MSKAKAPYNFIPFPDFFVTAYEKAEDLPRHDSTDPDLLSGEITVNMTAETPIIVKANNNQDSTFFTDANGEYVIPGASLRGLLRENMQILSFGRVHPGEDVEEQRLFYRNVAGRNHSVTSNSRTYYRNLLGANDTENLRSGYLFYDGLNEEHKEQYKIRPSKNHWVRVRLGLDKFSAVVVDGKPLKEKTSFCKECWYRIDENSKYNDAEEISWNEQDGFLHGYYLRPGRMNGQNIGYIIPEPDDDKTKWITLNNQDILNYKRDLETRKTTLKGTNENNPNDPEFWELPNKLGECKPVFYLKNGNEINFGFCRYIRVPFKNTVTEGIPLKHRNASFVIDYPYAIMGFANENNAYKSRISIGDMRTIGKVEKCGYSYRTVTASPKPSFFAGYLSAGDYDYNSETFNLRGYKQYWLQQEPNVSEGNNVKQVSILHPLGIGTSFTGTIRYKNLRDDELGLLLWSITLQNDSLQQIGAGKAYGLGIFKISIEKLVEYESADKMYRSFGYKLPAPADDDRINEYKKAFEEKIIELVNESHKNNGGGICYKTYTDIPTIADFLFMKSGSTRLKRTGSPHYQVNEFRNLDSRMDTVQEIRDSVQKSITALQDILPNPGNGNTNSAGTTQNQTGQLNRGIQISTGSRPNAAIDDCVTGTIVWLLPRNGPPYYAAVLDLKRDLKGYLRFNPNVVFSKGQIVQVKITGIKKGKEGYSDQYWVSLTQ